LNGLIQLYFNKNKMNYRYQEQFYEEKQFSEAYLNEYNLQAEHEEISYEIHLAEVLHSNILEMVGLINKIFKQILNMNYKKTFDVWIKEKPEIVQELAKKFPPGIYTMKEGSPYAITNPGIEVELYSWLETGDVGIIVKADDKSEDALEHENMLGAKYHKTEEEMEIIHKSSIRAHIDPEWLELQSSDLD
tara:strand:+ start:7614 stop:8183 length:570 start_codon:yes stop_codon:yes gene_type:complete